MYDQTLRRFGYLVRTGARSPILTMLERASLRPRPLNRAYPGRGHWLADCPICGAESGLFVAPDQATWTAYCVRGEFSIFELHAILIGGAAA